jgi:hypothetical protein
VPACARYSFPVTWQDYWPRCAVTENGPDCASQLEAAYQQVISAYNVHEVDFDIEGAALGPFAVALGACGTGG